MADLGFTWLVTDGERNWPCIFNFVSPVLMQVVAQKDLIAFAAKLALEGAAIATENARIVLEPAIVALSIAQVGTLHLHARTLLSSTCGDTTVFRPPRPIGCVRIGKSDREGWIGRCLSDCIIWTGRTCRHSVCWLLAVC